MIVIYQIINKHKTFYFFFYDYFFKQTYTKQKPLQRVFGDAEINTPLHLKLLSYVIKKIW